MRPTLLAILLLAGCATHGHALPISGELVTTITSTSTTTSSTTSTTTTTVPVTVAIVIERPMPSTTTSTTSTSTTLAVHPEPGPTLTDLIQLHFDPSDWSWAHQVAMCESSAHGRDTYSSAVNPTSGSTGWFQHLPKYWDERSEAAGLPGASMFDPVADVAVAAYLRYSTPQGVGHWYPSRHCWESDLIE